MRELGELSLSFLLNSAWQITIIALAALACAYFLQRRAAERYSHALLFAALLLCLALPARGLLDFHAETPAEISGPRVAIPKTLGDSDAATPLPAPKAAVVPTEENGLSFDRFFRRHRQPVSATPALLAALAACYLLFLFYRTLLLWRSWRHMRALRRSTFERTPNATLAAVIERCREALGVHGFRLKWSAKASAPVTVGAFDPVIILPLSFIEETSLETLTAVIGHEMAHIRRRDFALNFACELASLPVSFHPLVSQLKRKLERTRESACDEMVTERLVEPAAYARSLVNVAARLVSPRSQTLTLGIFDADTLEERIMTLKRSGRRTVARAGRRFALLALLLLCLSSLGVSTFSFDLRAARTSAVKEISAGSDKAGPTLSDSGAQEDKRAGSTGPHGKSLQTTINGSAQERAQAACAIGRKREVSAIPVLVAMLGDDDPVQPIKCWDTGRWSPALDSFKQPSPGEQAAIALASMGTPALKPLITALADANPSVRRNAAWAIGELTNMEEGERDVAVEPLITLLVDGDDWVRMAGARALGEIKDERAGERLIALLSDGEWRVRAMAAWALSEMKDERAVETLCRLLISDTQTEVRRMAAEALGEIRSPRAVSSLSQALNDSEPRVRAEARRALSEIDDSGG